MAHTFRINAKTNVITYTAVITPVAGDEIGIYFNGLDADLYRQVEAFEGWNFLWNGIRDRAIYPPGPNFAAGIIYTATALDAKGENDRRTDPLIAVIAVGDIGLGIGADLRLVEDDPEQFPRGAADATNIIEAALSRLTGFAREHFLFKAGLLGHWNGLPKLPNNAIPIPFGDFGVSESVSIDGTFTVQPNLSGLSVDDKVLVTTAIDFADLAIKLETQAHTWFPFADDYEFNGSYGLLVQTAILDKVTFIYVPTADFTTGPSFVSNNIGDYVGTDVGQIWNSPSGEVEGNPGVEFRIVSGDNVVDLPILVTNGDTDSWAAVTDAELRFRVRSSRTEVTLEVTLEGQPTEDPIVVNSQWTEYVFQYSGLTGTATKVTFQGFGPNGSPNAGYPFIEYDNPRLVSL